MLSGQACVWKEAIEGFKFCEGVIGHSLSSSGFGLH